MTKTEYLDRFSSTGEDRLLLARLLDKEEQARLRNLFAVTGFLSPAQQALCRELLHALPSAPHGFFGGYEGAERCVCAFFPDWMDPDDPADLPLAALLAKTTGGSGLTHRDFLGSLMGLGITREKLGDILVDEAGSQAQILCLSETLPILLTQWDKAGRYPLQLTPLPLSQLTPRPATGRTIHDTVASLRLDAVTAAGFSLPRSKAAGHITAGRVSVNHRLWEKPERLVSPGDTITCRGLGKCILTAVDGPTKKGRLSLTIERF